MKKIILSLIFFSLLASAGLAVAKLKPKPLASAPSPTAETARKLTPDQYPQVTLSFSSDGHFVTVNIANLHATALEYDLVYQASVKKNRIQTGVSAATKLEGQTTYSKKQLLGSESSGKFTYHENIKDGKLHLTLRDSAGRSVYSAIYPFEHFPGKTLELSPSE